MVTPTYPLTKPQQAIWSMEQFYGGAVAGITGSVLFDEPVAVEALQQALNQMVETFDSLRLRIQTTDGTPVQYIEPFQPTTFPVQRFTDLGQFDAWARSVAHTPIPITGPLYRVFIAQTGTRTGVLLHLHHLTADAWTLGLLVNSLRRFLAAETVSAGHYLDYLDAEATYAASPRAGKDAAWFVDCFQRCAEPVFLADSPARHPDSDRLSLTINPTDSAVLRRFCDEHEITPYNLFMTALAIYLGRIRRTDSLYLGTTVLNRAGAADKQTAGVFINTVPVLFELDDDASVIENLLNSGRQLSGVFRHQRYSYNDVLQDIRQRHGFTGRLFDVVLNYQNAVLEGDGMQVQWYFCGTQADTLAIHINDRQHEGVFHLDYDYQTEALSHRDVEILHEHLMNLLLDIVGHPEKKPWQLKLLSDAEYAQVITTFNDTAVDYASDRCVHQLFEEQVERTPEATAVVFHDQEYSYRQINAMSNALARRLRDDGVGRGDIVAIVAKRSHRIIVAQMAVLKAGAAYLPIDPSYPAERITFMLEDAHCKTALVDGCIVDAVPSISLDACDGDFDEENPAAVNTPDDLCYVIYTSGSTGKPKGVMIRHRNVVNYSNSNSNNVIYAIMTPGMKSILSTTTMSFDIFVTESLLPLANGKTIILADDTQSVQQSALNQLTLTTRPNLLQTTPSKMRLLMEDERCNQYLAGLQAIILGGETLDPAVVDRLRGYTDAKIFNIYGPTETTVWSTNAPVKQSADITIGKPIANTQIYVLDTHLNPLPIGEVGELYIGGTGVGAGYLNQPELTAQRFLPNPYHPGTMYQTGDLAKWRANGNIEYIGRADNQVKIRGLRVEPGEIEACLARYPGISQTAVVVHEYDNHQYLCAYYTGNQAVTSQLREFLSKTLPQHMVPHYFTRLAEMPTTPSGKLDRHALPTPDFAAAPSDNAYVAPHTNEEYRLAEIFQAVLSAQRVGIEDSFFELGGDSLKAIQLVAKASTAGFTFTLQDVFDHPTIAALARPTPVRGGPPGNGAIQKGRPRYDAQIAALLSVNTGTPQPSASRPLGDVLITGATGWLGSHLLDQYLATQCGTAYCLVRGCDQADASNRLALTMSRYFGDRHTNNPRIKPVLADITEPLAIEPDFETVIHCAADVKHYADRQTSYRVNVVGTQNVIKLAQQHGARLLHISTTTVSGNGLERHRDLPSPIMFDETMLDIGQSLDNVYVRTKFEAEIAVLEARRDGLDAQIARVGNLTNRHSDLAFHSDYRHNATLTALKALVDMGCYPASLSEMPLDFSPVDDTANALLTLLTDAPPNCSVFHACQAPIRLADFVAACTRAGMTMQPVEDDDFARRLQTTQTAHTVLDPGNLGTTLIVSSAFTTAVLEQAGYAWPPIDHTYLDRYIAYYTNLDYWRPHATQS